MSEPLSHSYTSFDGHRRIAAGTLATNALAVKKALESGATGPVLVFDDATGRCVDVDTRGTDAEVLARLPAGAPDRNKPDAPEATEKPRGRGRPRLGVVSREVTLLPRHWQWLSTQPGGASVTLRKLVEQARRANGEKDKVRKAHERAYHFMSALAGDLPGFEEVTRALFANDPIKFAKLTRRWPDDVRAHATGLAFPDERQTRT
ncbi:MAG: DUF2239 family protein [Chrysiogenetes bacterium]|nr:DUF2239 family protein [Chrysiogenetes bacterium]